MTFLLAWILASFGLAYVCGHAFITRGLREWAFEKPVLGYLVMLVECPACFGYWIGTLTGPWAFRHAGIPLLWWEASLLGSFLVCGSNYVLARWTQMIPAMEWMQPKVFDGAQVFPGTGLDPETEASRQQTGVPAFGICENKEYPHHHSIHEERNGCVDWRAIQTQTLVRGDVR